MKLWVIAIKDTSHEVWNEWGECWAFNHVNSIGSPERDVFFSIEEVEDWLNNYQDYWEQDGRDFCVHCEDINLEEWK